MESYFDGGNDNIPTIDELLVCLMEQRSVLRELMSHGRSVKKELLSAEHGSIAYEDMADALSQSNDDLEQAANYYLRLQRDLSSKVTSQVAAGTLGFEEACELVSNAIGMDYYGEPPESYASYVNQFTAGTPIHVEVPEVISFNAVLTRDAMLVPNNFGRIVMSPALRLHFVGTELDQTDDYEITRDREKNLTSAVTIRPLTLDY